MEKYNLVPADTYVVVNKTILHNEDRKIITSLYLPIIGTDAVMLYFTLWADLDNSEILSSEFSHQKLVSSLRITINELQTSFDKLEAIGLIKHKSPEHQILFLKAWNEWGEGDYVEPDDRFGHGWLNAIRNALNTCK